MTLVASEALRGGDARRPATVTPIGAARSARLAPVPPRPAAAPASAPVRAPEPVLRLTRRGRRVVRVLAGAALLLVAVLVVLLVNRPAAAGSRADVVPATAHVVLPGETLWGIVGEVAPGVDPRDGVERLMEFNALDSAAVEAGRTIAIPADLVRPAP
jgi:hypothetical protein